MSLRKKIVISEGGRKALLRLADGDMRKVLNVLQSTWMAYKDVTEDNIYACVGQPVPSDLQTILRWLLNESVKDGYTKIRELKTLKGYALTDILTEIHAFVHRLEMPTDKLIDLLATMADLEFYLAQGANENIQLTGLISAFQHARDFVLQG